MNTDRSISRFGVQQVEFVHESEVADLLRDHRLTRVAVGQDEVHHEMREDGIVRLHLACKESAAQPDTGAKVIRVDKDRLPKTLEHIIRLLGVDQILMIPIGKWRKVFDAVAFSLAENEDWQAIDAAATVELNTRDPLLCDPGDMHTLITLIETLFNDADQPDQGLTLLPSAIPVLIEVIPDGALRISLGNPALVDELSDALAA